MRHSDQRRTLLKLLGLGVTGGVVANLFDLNPLVKAMAATVTNTSPLLHPLSPPLLSPDSIPIARYSEIPSFLKELDDYETDFLGDLRLLIFVGFSQIPGFGPALGFLSFIIFGFILNTFSHPDNLWDQLRKQIEALIDQKIDENDFQLAKNKLVGLNQVLIDYSKAFLSHDPQIVKSTFISAHVAFDSAYGIFSDESRKITLLPLFVHFSYLHLTLLRDAVQNPVYTGLNDATTLTFYKNTLATRVRTYCDHIDETYTKLHDQALKDALQYEEEHDRSEGILRNVSYFYYYNRFERGMGITVQDFRFMLPFFDVYKYPKNAIVYNNRMLLSDPVGCNSEGSRDLKAPETHIHDITFWQNKGSVPCITHWEEGLWDGHNEQTVWWEAQGNLGPDHSLQDKVGMLFNQPAGKALAVLTQIPWNEGSGSELGQIQFLYEDGSFSPVAGFTRYGHPNVWRYYPGYYVDGIAWQSDVYDLQQIACVVWGFNQLAPQKIPIHLVNILNDFSERTGIFMAKKPEELSIYDCGLFTRPHDEL